MEIQTSIVPKLLTKTFYAGNVKCSEINIPNYESPEISGTTVITNQVTTPSSISGTLSMQSLRTSSMPIDNIGDLTIPNINVGTLKLTGAMGATGSFRANSVRTNQLTYLDELSCLKLATNTLSTSGEVVCIDLIATGMRAPSLAYDTVGAQELGMVTGTFDVLEIDSGTSNFVESNTADSDIVNSRNITATNLDAPEISTPNLFIGNTTGAYSVPEGSLFRGLLCSPYINFGKNIPATNSSLIMASQTGALTNTIIGFNEYLNAFDDGTGYGGNKAILSLSNRSSPYRTLRYEENGNLRIYSTPSTVLWESGTNISDKNLKESIRPVTQAMDIIMKLKPVTFEYTGDAEGCGKSAGLIAEDTETVFPHCVKNLGSNSIVDLTKVIPLLVAGIQELKERADRIKDIQEKLSEKMT